MVVSGNPFQVGLWDTAGQEDYDRLRPISYPNTDVFLVCFSLVSPDSLSNVEHKWYPEIKNFYPGNHPNIILVGTKVDLRDNRNHGFLTNDSVLRPIATADAIHVARKIHALKYLECSALTQRGVRQVFEEIVKVSVEVRKKREKKGKMCTIV